MGQRRGCHRQGNLYGTNEGCGCEDRIYVEEEKPKISQLEKVFQVRVCKIKVLQEPGIAK